MYNKTHSFKELPLYFAVNTLTKLVNYFFPEVLELLQKKRRPKWDKTDNLRLKHCMFRTQIYASPENFTPPLEVIEVTYRRSGFPSISALGKSLGAAMPALGKP